MKLVRRLSLGPGDSDALALVAWSRLALWRRCDRGVPHVRAGQLDPAGRAPDAAGALAMGCLIAAGV